MDECNRVNCVASFIALLIAAALRLREQEAFSPSRGEKPVRLLGEQPHWDRREWKALCACVCVSLHPCMCAGVFGSSVLHQCDSSWGGLLLDFLKEQGQEAERPVSVESRALRGSCLLIKLLHEAGGKA